MTQPKIPLYCKIIRNKAIYANKKFLNWIERNINNTTNITSNELPAIIKRKVKTEKIITHVSAFTYGNAGDTILPISLRDLWHVGNEDISWQSQPVYPIVTQNIVDKINNSKGLIIGGGGLFLKDTNANNLSGWQWPCSQEMLERINVPIILFAVGYNRFRGQDEFEPIFTDSIQAFAKKAEYIGLRNYGSINAIKYYLPESLHYKLRFQPCMTTFLSKLYPDLCDYSFKENFVAINAAFDRSNLRFGGKIGGVLDAMARTAKEIVKHYPIKFYSHMPSDEAFIPFLQAHNVKFELVKLNNVHPSEIVKAYAKPKLVLGMRGHAQMIPFGCKTPVISIVSHNKMQWFLDDIKQPLWGADVLNETFEHDLLSRSLDALNNFEKNIQFIEDKQQELYHLSLENVSIGLSSMNIQ
jgi:polysaccharide pyruvyl transferase WcaK-like protein